MSQPSSRCHHVCKRVVRLKLATWMNLAFDMAHDKFEILQIYHIEITSRFNSEIGSLNMFGAFFTRRRMGVRWRREMGSNKMESNEQESNEIK